MFNKTQTAKIETTIADNYLKLTYLENEEHLERLLEPEILLKRTSIKSKEDGSSNTACLIVTTHLYTNCTTLRLHARMKSLSCVGESI